MKTLKQLRDQVISDLDLQEEEWISESEINVWINEGIKSAEAQIHTLYEDYFLCESDAITIIKGQNLVDYPADIYATKVRKVIFTDGLGNSTASHEVRRIKSLINAKSADLYSSDTDQAILKWSPVNKAGVGRKLRLFPETGRSGNLFIWYIRAMNQLVLDDDVCEVDEFSHYVVQYAKTKAFLKDGDSRADDSKILEEQYKQDMIDTLSEMVPDGDNELDMDMEHYIDSVGGEY